MDTRVAQTLSIAFEVCNIVDVICWCTRELEPGGIGMFRMVLNFPLASLRSFEFMIWLRRILSTDSLGGLVNRLTLSTAVTKASRAWV